MQKEGNYASLQRPEETSAARRLREQKIKEDRRRLEARQPDERNPLLILSFIFLEQHAVLKDAFQQDGTELKMNSRNLVCC